MRILVTGSAGFIGQNLLHRLAGDPNYQVWALDLRRDYEAPPAVTHASNITLCAGDAGTTDIIGANGIEAVVHLAGSAGVRESDAVPLHYIDNNIRVTTHLFEQARLHGVRRVVYASSSSVYGPGGPCSIYGVSKAVCDDIAAYYHRRHALSSIGLRFFTVYGRYGRSNMAVASFTEKMLQSKPIDVYGDGTQTRDFTHVDDVVDVIMRALSVPGPRHGVYDVGPEAPLSVNELVRLIADELSVPLPAVVHTERHAADVPNTKADTSSLSRDLGIRPATLARDGIRAYVLWHTSERQHSRREDAF